MMRASPTARAAWIVLPSGPGRRTRTSALSTFSQNSISSSGFRHTSVGITLGDVSGMGFTMTSSSHEEHWAFRDFSHYQGVGHSIPERYLELFGMSLIFPAQTWVDLKNIGTDSISLVFIFSAPGFEKNMRCGSGLAGQTAPPINTDELKACAHEG